jgi:hypothetical protein
MTVQRHSPPVPRPIPRDPLSVEDLELIAEALLDHSCMAQTSSKRFKRAGDSDRAAEFYCKSRRYFGLAQRVREEWIPELERRLSGSGIPVGRDPQ